DCDGYASAGRRIMHLSFRTLVAPDAGTLRRAHLTGWTRLDGLRHARAGRRIVGLSLRTFATPHADTLRCAHLARRAWSLNHRHTCGAVAHLAGRTWNEHTEACRTENLTRGACDRPQRRTKTRGIARLIGRARRQDRSARAPLADRHLARRAWQDRDAITFGVDGLVVATDHGSGAPVGERVDLLATRTLHNAAAAVVVEPITRRAGAEAFAVSPQPGRARRRQAAVQQPIVDLAGPAFVIRRHHMARFVFAGVFAERTARAPGCCLIAQAARAIWQLHVIPPAPAGGRNRRTVRPLARAVELRLFTGRAASAGNRCLPHWASRRNGDAAIGAGVQP